MMNSNELQQSDDSAKVWFNNVYDVNQPQPPKRPNKKRFVLIVSIAVLVASLIIAVVASVLTVSKPCLTAQDYEALTGTTQDTLLSPQAFYTTSFDFKPGTADYLATSQQDYLTTIKRIADFYAERADSKSIIVSVSSDYFDVANKQLAEERLSKLRSDITGSGVSESSILLKPPTQLKNDGEIDDESSEITDSPSYLTVSSLPDCKE